MNMNEDTYRNSQLNNYLDHRSEIEMNSDIQEKDEIIHTLLGILSTALSATSSSDESAVMHLYGGTGELPSYIQKEIAKECGAEVVAKLEARHKEFWSLTSK